MESRPIIPMILCGFAALVLAAVIALESRAADPQDPDVLVRLFGGTAEVAAEGALARADLYLHAGTGRKCPDHQHASNYDHRHALPLLSFVERLHGETAPREHKHIQGEEERELLPWFVIAARLNPCNTDAWRTGAYWFYRTGQLRRAEEFVTEGIRRNPRDYRLYVDRGILYRRMKRWNDAIRELKLARRLCPRTGAEVELDRRAIQRYLKDCVGHARTEGARSFDSHGD